MIKLVVDYFVRLSVAFGHGWTRFWFTPADPSTLSAIRLLMGLVVIYLHATLSWDLLAFFGPAGLLPAVDISPLEGDTFSYLNFLSTPGELWTAHLLGLAVLILFAAGLWTRLTSVLALVVFLSDVLRAPMIAGRTEIIAAMVLLYLCIGPSGRRFSLDALRERAASPADRSPSNMLSTSASIAIRLMQVHLALLIAMMGFSQLMGETWWTGQGMWWLIARPESRLVDLTWLYAMPKLLDFWTHAIVLFEFAFPVLIWVPLARPLLLATGVLVWASLAVVTGDITFALTMGIASLAFVSPALLWACCPPRSESAEIVPLSAGTR